MAYRRSHTREPSRVSLMTTAGPDGHVHAATFDGRGDGVTDEAPDGHWHRVTQLEVEGFNGHTHQITSTRAVLTDVAGEASVRRRAGAQGG